MLTVDHLTARYPRQKIAALQGVSLHVDPGERVALLGPSGAGKTTLFRCINGSIPAESGSVRLGEAEVSSAKGKALRRIRSQIAVIAQKHDLVDGLRVYQNVMAGALGRWSSVHALRFLLWPTRAELQEAEEALVSVNLQEKLKARTNELSGGQQQRVAIARALVQRPLVILADEPVASLDPVTAAQVLELLCGLARDRGIALLCSLHQPELAREYFDRFVRMEDGRAYEPQPASRIPQSSLVRS